MTLKYQIAFTNGRKATMLDPEEKPLPEIQASILDRFGEERVKHIERDTEYDDEPPLDGGFLL